MSFLKSLEQLTDAEFPAVGGKVANCARLKAAGFPVPDGFVLLASSDALDVDGARLAAHVRPFAPDTLFAVRSSASDEDGDGHSFAGVHETLLNVPISSLPSAIEKCWQSMRSSAALQYRRSRGLATSSIRTSIFVQEMAVSHAAGVAFTIDPVNGETGEMLISAAWGLGEAVTSGVVEPDEIRVRKSDGEVLAYRRGDKAVSLQCRDGAWRTVENSPAERAAAVLNEAQLSELVALLRRIEQFYDAPQDVEWCHDGSRFYVLQSRPVTSGARRLPPLARSGSDDIEWTRANMCEVLPELPSHQTLVSTCQLNSQGMARYYRNLLAPVSRLGPMVKDFYGRPYFNLSQLRMLCKNSGTAPASVLASIGHTEELSADDYVGTRPPLPVLLRVLPDLMHVGFQQFTIVGRMQPYFESVEQYVAWLEQADAAENSDAAVVEVLKTWNARSLESLDITYALGSMVVAQMLLEAICKSVGYPYDKLWHAQLAAGEKTVSAQQSFELLTLAHMARRDKLTRSWFMSDEVSAATYTQALAGTEFLRHFEQYLERFGHRGNYESDWSLPRFKEDPTPLLQALTQLVRADKCPVPSDIYARQQAEAEAAWADMLTSMRGWKRLVLPAVARWAVKRIKQMYVLRERHRFEMVRMISALRRWHLVLADRFIERGWLASHDEYFSLTLEEVYRCVAEPAWGQQQARLIAADRRRERALYASIKMPYFMRESDFDRNFNSLASAAPPPPPPADGTLQLQGLAVSPGVVEGPVVVLEDSGVPPSFPPGAILVSSSNPTWTPLFTMAGGIVVEIGGTLSHASTLAREYGVPAIVNVKHAARMLRTGDRVRLDAGNGMVQLLERRPTVPEALSA
jgi:pyruvate,water dikinase